MGFLLGSAAFCTAAVYLGLGAHKGGDGFQLLGLQRSSPSPKMSKTYRLIDKIGTRAQKLLSMTWYKTSGRQLFQEFQRRQDEKKIGEICERLMPEFLDILGLGLSAGLSFDSSLELYCHERDNELAHQLRGALQSWQMGLENRSQALAHVAQITACASLQSFASVVGEAIAFGTPLSSTFEHQAETLREEQRVVLEQKVEETPVRMIIPLGIFIVPSMLLAIMGPLLSAAFSL